MVNDLITKFFGRIASVDTTLDDFSEESIELHEDLKTRSLLKIFNCCGLQFDLKFKINVNDSGKRILSYNTPICKSCGSKKVKRNGYNYLSESTKEKLDFDLPLAKYICRSCEDPFCITKDEVFPYIKYIDELVNKKIISLKEKHLSDAKTASDIEKTMGIHIHENTVYNRYKKLRKQIISTIEVSENNLSGYFSYDEQYLKVNGKTRYRLVLYDIINEKLVKEKFCTNMNKVEMKSFLEETVPSKEAIVLVSDGVDYYKDVFKSVFGKDVLTQKCIFHLMKNVSQEYRSKFYSKLLKKKIPFIELKFKQELFDVFFPRPKILKFLRKVRAIEREKGLTKDEQKMYRQKYYFLVEQQRKREKKIPDKYTRDHALKKFKNVLRQIDRYPKKVQKKIKTIDKNWEEHTNYLVENKFLLSGEISCCR